MGVDHYAQLRGVIRRATSVYLLWQTRDFDHHVRIPKRAAIRIVDEAEENQERLTLTIFPQGDVWIDRYRRDDGWIDKIGC